MYSKFFQKLNIYLKLFLGDRCPRQRPPPPQMRSPPPQMLTHMLVNVGALCMGVGLFSLGVLCALSPEFAASAYGVPIDGDSAWVAAVGLRDLSLGLSTVGILFAAPQALRIFVPCCVLIAVVSRNIQPQFGTQPEPSTVAHVISRVASLCLAAHL